MTQDTKPDQKEPLNYSPNSGEPRDPRMPALAASFRPQVSKPEPWRFDPWSGQPRTEAEIAADPYGHDIVPPSESPATTHAATAKREAEGVRCVCNGSREIQAPDGLIESCPLCCENAPAIEHVYPPIPDRSHDYRAYHDPEGLCGWGATPLEAARDLAMQESDAAEERPPPPAAHQPSQKPEPAVVAQEPFACIEKYMEGHVRTTLYREIEIGRKYFVYTHPAPAVPEVSRDAERLLKWWQQTIYGSGYSYQVSREAIEETISLITQLAGLGGGGKE